MRVLFLSRGGGSSGEKKGSWYLDCRVGLPEDGLDGLHVPVTHANFGRGMAGCVLRPARSYRRGSRDSGGGGEVEGKMRRLEVSWGGSGSGFKVTKLGQDGNPGQQRRAAHAAMYAQGHGKKRPPSKCMKC